MSCNYWSKIYAIKNIYILQFEKDLISYVERYNSYIVWLMNTAHIYSLKELDIGLVTMKRSLNSLLLENEEDVYGTKYGDVVFSFKPRKKRETRETRRENDLVSRLNEHLFFFADRWHHAYAGVRTRGRTERAMTSRTPTCVRRHTNNMTHPEERFASERKKLPVIWRNSSQNYSSFRW